MYDLEELSAKDKLVRRLLNGVTVVRNVTLALVTLAPLSYLPSQPCVLNVIILCASCTTFMALHYPRFYFASVFLICSASAFESYLLPLKDVCISTIGKHWLLRFVVITRGN